VKDAVTIPGHKGSSLTLRHGVALEPSGPDHYLLLDEEVAVLVQLDEHNLTTKLRPSSRSASTERPRRAPFQGWMGFGRGIRAVSTDRNFERRVP